MQSSRTFNSFAARAALLVCCAAMTGCVGIPIPTALPDPEPFTPETLAPIRIGVTTRDEVRSLFADWTYTTDDGVQTAHIEPQASDDGRYWVFGLRRQIGDVSFVGLSILNPLMLPVPFLAGTGDNFQNSWVLVEFSEHDTVAAVWMASDKTPCRNSGVCYHERYLQIIADEAANATARSSVAVTDRCVLYTYAEDDFRAPVTVTDGIHAAQVFAKTSFVRTEMAVGPQTVSAWVSVIPARVAAVPMTCVGDDVHYVALRHRDGLIEAKQESASTGKRAIAQRFLVERLVAAQPSVAPNPNESVWTNCTSTDPCRQLVMLDEANSTAIVYRIKGEDGQIHDVANVNRAPRLLHPGRYLVESRWPAREDTIDLEAGHRYRLENRGRFGGGLTSWIEDIATKRVVAGAKWCTSAADCPGSSCTKSAGDSPALCDIPELLCTAAQIPWNRADDFQYPTGTRPGRCVPRPEHH